MLVVSQLFIYPIKSLGGIAVQSACLSATGFTNDRRWMLADEQNVFLSQRTSPQMALLQPEISSEGLMVFHKHNRANQVSIPFLNGDGKKVHATIWEDTCEAYEAGNDINEWFSDMLQIKCKLLYMPAETRRLVDSDYAFNNEVTSFSDAYPLMMIGQNALDLLNSKLEIPLGIDRFRPNIVFSGGKPHCEDEMAVFTINNTKFFGVKPCARCIVTTINQQTSEKSAEPLKTLAAYRAKNNKIFFGQNILHQNNGLVKVGDEITIASYSPPFL
jgi:uncharacterized protein